MVIRSFFFVQWWVGGQQSGCLCCILGNLVLGSSELENSTHLPVGPLPPQLSCFYLLLHPLCISYSLSSCIFSSFIASGDNLEIFCYSQPVKHHCPLGLVSEPIPFPTPPLQLPLCDHCECRRGTLVSKYDELSVYATNWD